MEKNIKILVVEDSNAYQFEIKYMLTKYIENIDILMATYKQDAEDEYEKNPDLCLLIVDLDISLNKNSGRSNEERLGLAFLEEIYNKNENLHLIAYTSFDDNESKQRCKRIGASFVKKYGWASQSDLVTKVVSLLSKGCFQHKIS